jgi:uncharacterized protein
MSASRLAIFLSALLSIAGGGHYYLFVKLVKSPAWPGKIGVALAATLWGMMALLLVTLLMRDAPRHLRAPFSWIGFSWLGLFFVLFMGFLLGEVVTLCIKLVTALQGAPLDEERRRFIARAIAGSVGLVSLLMGGAGLVSALSKTAVKRVAVKLKTFGTDSAPFTLVQLTDVHVGPTIGKAFIREVVDQVNALAPDAIVITGDLVDGTVDELREHVAPLADLKAKEGVFFVTGNHEYYSGADAWIEHLTSLGIRVLRNEGVELSQVFLAGVDDATAHQFGNGHGEDVAKVASAWNQSETAKKKPFVLLAHQPKTIVSAALHNVALQLSGHTHGGQIFPWNFFVRLQQPYVAGLYAHNEATQLYVSCGTGYWGPPMRVGAPAEITHLTLTRA